MILGDGSHIKTPASVLERLSTLYNVVRHINRAIVRERTRDGLFSEVCRAAVEHGGFLMAWVGWHDPERQLIVPVAQWGDDNDYLKTVTIHADERPQGRGPTGLALRSGRPYICNDFFGDPATKSWRTHAELRGIRASAAFPIRVQGAVCGVLSVYAKESGYFQGAEVALLEEAAVDISFALENFERENARRRAEEMATRLAAIIEFTNDAVISHSLDGAIASWNQAAEKMFGYLATEIVGRNIMLLIPPERTGEEQKMLERIANGGFIVDFETVRIRNDGRRFPVSVTVSPILSAAGSVVGASKIVRDISDRMRAQAALLEAESQFEAVVENLNEGVLIYDMKGEILRSNSAARTMLAFPKPEEFPSDLQSFFELFEVSAVEGDILPDEQRPLARVARGEDLRDYEVRVRRTDTTWERIISYSGTVVGDIGGKSLAFVTLRDVTEQKKTADAMRLSELRLRNAQRIAHVGSWEWDVPNDKLHWSDQLFEIFGIAKEQFEGNYQAFLCRIHPADRDAIERAKRAVLSGNAPLDIEHRAVLPDGSVKYLHLLGDLVRDGKGEPLRLSGTALDITARHQAADALREANANLERRVRERTEELAVAKERAESADRLKSAFLATMSHELRTPLNSIIGFTGIILQELPGPLNPEQSTQLGMVRSSARHLLELINDVLDLSKIEAGQLEIRANTFDLGASLEKVLATVKPMAEKKSLSLRLASSSELGSLVSDERRVEQVLLNLLNNAIKFTERGGVELSAELLNQHTLRHAMALRRCVRFRVSDTGMGIQRTDLANLFQPFRQIDTGLTRQHEGTGLGLAICRRLADLLGGEIYAESQYSAGSVFTFTVPVTPEE